MKIWTLTQGSDWRRQQNLSYCKCPFHAFRLTPAVRRTTSCVVLPSTIEPNCDLFAQTESSHTNKKQLQHVVIKLLSSLDLRCLCLARGFRIQCRFRRSCVSTTRTVMPLSEHFFFFLILKVAETHRCGRLMEGMFMDLQPKNVSSRNEVAS